SCGGHEPAHCSRLEQTFDNLGHSHLNRFRLLCDSHEARLPPCTFANFLYSCATPAIYRLRRRFLGRRRRRQSSSSTTASHYQREHHRRRSGESSLNQSIHLWSELPQGCCLHH